MALTDNLVAYYKMDGNSNDSVGSNNGTDTSISYVTGKINQGAGFNGSSSRIVIADNSSLRISGNITMSFWTYLTSRPTGTYSFYTFITKKYNGTNQGYYFDLFCDGGPNTVIRCGSYYNPSDYNTVSNFTDSELNVWVNWVGIYDGTAWKLYKNGNLISSTNQASGAISSNEEVDIGFANLNGSYARYLNGAIDEVGIWSRALSPTEVSQLYNSGAGLSYPFTTNKPSLFPFFNQYL